jgi:hypothetical protein
VRRPDVRELISHRDKLRHTNSDAKTLQEA